MLACGSEATPAPEGREGALGRLVAAGLDEVEAHDLIGRLATDDRAAALARLGARGLDPERILPATHCAPPPGYLVLSSRQIAHPGWARLGDWDVHGGRPVSSPELAPGRDLEARIRRSTFARLMLDEGRDAPAFERLAEEIGYGGERVVTWRIRWPSPD
jgi:hypothetical protein